MWNLGLEGIEKSTVEQIAVDVHVNEFENDALLVPDVATCIECTSVPKQANDVIVESSVSSVIIAINTARKSGKVHRLGDDASIIRKCDIVDRFLKNERTRLLLQMRADRLQKGF